MVFAQQHRSQERTSSLHCKQVQYPTSYYYISHLNRMQSR